MCRLVCLVSGVVLVILCSKLAFANGPSALKYLQDPASHVENAEEGSCVQSDCFGKEEARVALAAAACGDRFEEVMVMVKSAVVLTKLARLDVIIFTEDELVEKFSERVAAWPEAVKHRTNVR
jgi:UDP-xylose:glucoside alpha-1,3-xylosyltransferase